MILEDAISFLPNFPHLSQSFPIFPYFSSLPSFPAVHHEYASGYVIRNSAGYI